MRRLVLPILAVTAGVALSGCVDPGYGGGYGGGYGYSRPVYSSGSYGGGY